MARHIWLDITGVRPGSDAAALAFHLGTALRNRGGVTFCQRTPGMEVVNDARILALQQGRTRLRTGHFDASLLRHMTRLLPERARLSLGRVQRLQNAATQAWRSAIIRAPRRPGVQQVKDTATPAANDILVMLCAAGDAARFAHNGAKLVFMAADTAVLTRPDWLSAHEAAEAVVWRQHTSTHVSSVIAFSDASAQSLINSGCKSDPVMLTAAGTLPQSLATDERPARPFILAAGEIGEAGQTRHLLLAWRLLLDEIPASDVPVLVLAGPIGAMTGDLLEQLRNSRLFDGHVQIATHPDPRTLARLTRTCLFTIATGHSAWGRATWDSLGAGKPCLSVFPAPGATHIEAASPRKLAAAVRMWLEQEPTAPPMPGRQWIDVAAEIMKAINP